MYSYQHKYHAGNIADLHKHTILIAILEYMKLKPSSFCVIDAFSGDGLYDLKCSESLQNKEYETGYGLLNNIRSGYVYFDKLSSLEKDNIYPGSPYIITKTIRANDRAIFIENHPQSHKQLIKNIHQNKNISIYKKNCYEMLYSIIKFKETRGLIFLDPSYEVKSEYDEIAKLVTNLYKIKSSCIYIIWYPILSIHNYYRTLVKRLYAIKNITKVWHHQILYSGKKSGLIGSGIFVINMPWSIDVILEKHFEHIDRKEIF